MPLALERCLTWLGLAVAACLVAAPAAEAQSPQAPRSGITGTERIHLDRLKLPPGFKVEIWAHGMPGARSMVVGNKGTMFVGTRNVGRVYTVKDDGNARDVKVLLQGLRQPNGLAFRDGALYVAAIEKVLRYDGIEDKLGALPEPVDLSAAFKLPSDSHHGWKYLAFGPDGKLYVPIGAPCNVCERNETHSQIRRYNPDGTGMEIVAKGVRNTVGFDFHPETRELWFTDNGRDNAGENEPEDELNRMAAAGANYGFPYCHAQGIPDRDIRKNNPCDGVTMPVALMGPHAAALGMRFYSGQMFPPEYRGRIFVARHGSWNRSQKFGYDVVSVTATPDGKQAKVEPFLTGFLDTAANTAWGRPVDVHVDKDGALLVSDDESGAIYRVSYSK